MLKIRLQRVGRKNDPSFRLVVTEHTNAAKKSGRFAEVLGSYNARQGEPVVKGERVKHWLSVGAKPSITAHNLLVKLGLIESKTKNPLPKKTVSVKVEDKAPVSEAVGAPTPEEGAGVEENNPVEA